MGWLFNCTASKQDIIHKLTKPFEGKEASSKTIAKCVLGNVMWSVVEMTAKVDGVCSLAAGQPLRFIALHLLKKSRDSGWGYKDMCESMGPYYYNCPLGYLDMAPEQCPEWRAKVRAWHADQKDRATWKAGDQVICRGNDWNPYVLIEPYRKHRRARKSGWIVMDKWKVKWRLSSHQLKDAERVVDDRHKLPVDAPTPEQVCLL